MSDQILDEFDKKAKMFIEEKNFARIKDILREYVMCVAYEEGEEIDNPSRFLRTSGIDIDNIRDFTEYRVAKSVLRTEIKRKHGSHYFKKLRKNITGGK